MEMPAGVHKCARVPKGNNIKGKIWWDATVILPDGRNIHGRYESTRGAFFYFEVDGQHYRAFVDRFKSPESYEGHGIFNMQRKADD